MITLRTSPFDLLDRLEQQVSQAERVPAAEVIETNASYTVRLELPGVDHDSIDVKATDRSLVISAERQPTISAEDNTPPTESRRRLKRKCAAAAQRVPDGNMESQFSLRQAARSRPIGSLLSRRHS